VYLAAALFAGFILAGSLIRFPDEVQLPFVLKADKSEDIYRFSYPIYLMDKYVASGSSIKKGTKLLRITSPEIVTMINNYNEAQQNMLNYSGQKTLSVEQQRAITGLKIEQDKKKITEVENELVVLDNTWKSNEARLEFQKKDAESKLEQNKKLHASRYISSLELKQYETQKVIANDSAVTGRQNYEKEKTRLLSLKDQYSLDVLSLGNEQKKLSIDTRFDSMQLINQLALTSGKIKNTFGDYEIFDGGLVLKANADGVVSYLFDGDKEIPGGSILLKTRYSNTPLYSAISVPASLVGKLRDSLEVFLKVATFPAYEWGASVGHIDNISLTPDENGTFNVRVVIDNMRKLNGRLQAGMNGNATIVLSEKTFFEYFSRSVKKTYYNTTQNN